MWWRKRGRALFRDHELAVLDALGTAIGGRGHELLDGQVAAIEMVQRMFGDGDVLLYPKRRGPQVRDPANVFPNQATELRLATARVSGPAGKGKVTVDAVCGHVFQLTFSPSPKRLGDRRAITVAGVTLHADPMLPDHGEAARRRLASIHGDTRDEYERLLADDVGLFGSDEVYSIHLDDGEYLVLAQLDDTTYVAAPIDPSRSGVRRFWPDGDPVGDYPTIGSALDHSLTRNDERQDTDA